MMMKNKRRLIISLTIVLLLLIPLIAMQFTAEVNWTPLDFMVAAVLLSITGFSIDLIARKVKRKKHRIYLSIATLLIFFLVWAELAVGIL
jgi:hypothetical protein